MQNKDPNFPPAVERALSIFDYIGDSESPKSIKEMSDELKIPYASAYRIVQCLVKNGYLAESNNSVNRYLLGYKFLLAGRMKFNSYSPVLPEIIHPYLQSLASVTGQVSQLCILADDAIITLDQAIPTNTIVMIAKIGVKIPINASASGKILVSLLPEIRRDAFLLDAHKLFRKNTPNTIMDLDEFKASIMSCAESGYGLDMEEYALKVGCMAVPIRTGRNQHVFAAIGLTGSIDNYLNKTAFNLSLEALRKTQKDINDHLSS